MEVALCHTANGLCDEAVTMGCDIAGWIRYIA
jgi:hypothetical protein